MNMDIGYIEEEYLILLPEYIKLDILMKITRNTQIDSSTIDSNVEFLHSQY